MPCFVKCQEMLWSEFGAVGPSRRAGGWGWGTQRGSKAQGLEAMPPPTAGSCPQNAPVAMRPSDKAWLFWWKQKKEGDKRGSSYAGFSMARSAVNSDLILTIFMLWGGAKSSGCCPCYGPLKPRPPSSSAEYQDAELGGAEQSPPGPPIPGTETRAVPRPQPPCPSPAACSRSRARICFVPSASPEGGAGLPVTRPRPLSAP